MSSYDKSNQNEDICWGRNPVFSLLEETPDKCVKILLSTNIQPHIKSRITKCCREEKIPFQIVDSVVLNRLTNKSNHQGVVAYVSPIKLWDIQEFLNTLPDKTTPAMMILCDHVQDPHNLGAIIRSAEAAGASAVVIPSRGSCLPTGTVVKTSSGAALHLPVVKIGNISQAIKLLQKEGFWIVGLSMEGEESLFKEDMHPRTVFVVGAEGLGLGRIVAKACDEIRHIPIKGTVGSLNVSMASTLAMFEWNRSKLTVI